MLQRLIRLGALSSKKRRYSSRRLLIVSTQKSGTRLTENVMGMAGLERRPGSGGHTAQSSVLGLAENRSLRFSYPLENPLLGRFETERRNGLCIVYNVRDPFAYLDKNEVGCDAAARQAFDTGSAAFRKGRIGGYREERSDWQLRKVNGLHGYLIRQFCGTSDPQAPEILLTGAL
jgi:hypothetical protein